jgi:hypothetical protein
MKRDSSSETPVDARIESLAVCALKVAGQIAAGTLECGVCQGNGHQSRGSNRRHGRVADRQRCHRTRRHASRPTAEQLRVGRERRESQPPPAVEALQASLRSRSPLAERLDAALSVLKFAANPPHALLFERAYGVLDDAVNRRSSPLLRVDALIELCIDLMDQQYKKRTEPFSPEEEAEHLGRHLALIEEYRNGALTQEQFEAEMGFKRRRPVQLRRRPVQ